MTDITRKLELVANLNLGDMWPAELGTAGDWGTALSAICAEALAEITALRKQVNTFDAMTNRLMAADAELLSSHPVFLQKTKTVEWSVPNDPTSFEPSPDIGSVRTPPHQDPEWPGIKLIPGTIVKTRKARVDILDHLKKAGEMRPGTANSDVNVYAQPVHLTWGDMDAAIKEIERLRAHERASERWLAELAPYPPQTPSLRPPTDDPKLDPWGSAYAMNTENWK